MNQSILKKYQVTFFIKTIFNENFKSLNTIDTYLTSYLTDFNDLERVGLLLSDVNSVLDGTYNLGGGQTQSMYYSEVKNNHTKIYKDYENWELDNNITPDFTLPTSDFKIILEAWKSFLTN